jgi:hypothetical protein
VIASVPGEHFGAGFGGWSRGWAINPAKTWNNGPISFADSPGAKRPTGFRVAVQSRANAKASREEGHSEVNCELEGRSRRSYSS